MEDQDQLLKDFVATAQKYGYDYDVVMPKFPEFEGYDVEMLKGYVSKVEELNQGSSVYDYTEANAAFSELFAQKKKRRDRNPICIGASFGGGFYGVYAAHGDSEWRFGFCSHKNEGNR